jgi:Proteins containing SET domain
VDQSNRAEAMSVNFCNKSCVKKDFHFKYEKPCLPKLVAIFQADVSCISDLLLLGRCLRTSTEKYLDYSKQLPTKNEDCYYQNTFQDLQNMVYGKDDSRNEHVKIVKTLIELFKEGQETPEDELLNILKRFGCNNFSITNKLMVSVAAACVPLGALLNHSCDPNCVVTYRIMENYNNRIVQQIRTVKDVKEGEELCHPYLDTACTTANRVEKLKKDYNFICQCTRCAEDKKTLLVRMPDGLIHELIQAIKANTNNQISDEQLTLFLHTARSTPV